MLPTGDISFTDVQILESGSLMVNSKHSVFTVKQAGVYFFQLIGFCEKGEYVRIYINGHAINSFRCFEDDGYVRHVESPFQQIKGGDTLIIRVLNPNSIVINSPTKELEFRAYIVRKE